MDNTLNFLQTGQPVNAAVSPSRRSFMRYLSVGAAALVVEGCGGGAADTAVATPSIPPVAGATAPVAAPAPAPAAPAVTAPAPSAPVWLSIPTIAFTQGTPSSFSVADYIPAASAAAFTLSLNEAPLPAGVTFNAATRSFSYDGQGAVASTEGHMLTAVGG